MKDTKTTSQKLRDAIETLNQDQLRELKNFIRKLREEDEELDRDGTHKDSPLQERD